MKSGVPWQIDGVRRQARDTAQEAARRSGMSVGEWLDTVILDSALLEGVEQGNRPHPRSDRYGPHDDAAGRDEDTCRDGGAYREEQLRPGRRPHADDDRAPPAGYDDHDRPTGLVAHRQPAAADARRRAAELAERLSLAGVEPYPPAADQGFAGLNDRLDSLTRQLGELAQMHAANAQTSRPDSRDEEPSRQLVEVISKLDRRLDQLIAEGRSAKTELEQGVNAVDREVADLNREKPRTAVADAPPTPLDQALIEIAERQRTLDGYAPVAAGNGPAATLSAALPRARTQELSGLEQQLRQINTQIETLRQPCGLDKAIETLRDDLAEIGLMLQEAMPRKAVEALENEVRNLADRVDHTRDAGADGATLAGVERGLAEVRDALRALTPAENLVGVDRAVQQLSQKIDLITSNAQDPAALKQLEGAIVTMRGIVSHVASNDALAKLSEEVRALAGKVDQAASPPGGSVLASLEGRIAMLADALEARNQSGQNVPHELETVVKGLIDKIERIQLTRGEHAALGHLEDRIAQLVEKLDASDARLNHLEAIERGLAELLIHLEHQRMPNLAQAGASPLPEVDLLSRDIADLQQTEKKTQDSLEVVHGTLGHVVDRLAMIETDMRGKPEQPMDAATTPKATPVPPAPSQAPQPIELAAAPQPIEFAAAPQTPKPASPPAAERRPIDPNLPPDHPLEPGSGMARGRNPSSPADRIAASEAALGSAKPPVIPDPGGKSDFIAAARRAAQAAGRDAPAKNDVTAPGEIASAAGKLASRVGKLRTLIGAATAILLVLGSLLIARTLLGSSDEAQVAAPSQVAATTPDDPATTAAAAVSAPAAANEPASAPPTAAPAAGRQSALFPAVDGTAIATPAPGIVIPLETTRQTPTATTPKAGGAAPAVGRDITGSVSASAKPAKPVTAPAPAPAPAAPTATLTPPALAIPPTAAEKLPAAFGSGLRAAAARGDSAAQHEVALRYAEGRGVPQSLTDAVEWFERAAKQGLAPAQFRLGGFYEKGLGVQKNLETARRFYIAAGEAGHAKALHNLAVLHAEGIDGRPDYQTAAKWFRKAADYGVADSQYNLAILYARGIGVEQNLAEAYKWFALAAREGDADAAKKRDDMGARLDQQSLKAASQAAQGWTPEQQPEAASQVKMPPGGWEGAPAAVAVSAPAPSKRKPPVATPKLDLATPRRAQ